MKSDRQLQKEVSAELDWEPSVNAVQIGVEVKDGIVTLEGQVGSYAEKWDAEHAAQRVAGVKALNIEIDVVLYEPNERYDSDIARAAENVLQWTTALQKDSVRVMVENGCITLSGTVDWNYQRQAATAAVRYLMGVTGVSDQIVVTPKTTIAAVKSDIETALQRRAHDDAKKLSVIVNGSSVTLKGVVHSWSERNLAVHSAWGSPGVRNVVDQMTVAY